MITSGFLSKHRYPSSRFKVQTFERPFVDGFDKGVTITSDPHAIENNRPKYSIPVSVKYRQIFGKGLNADDSLYFLVDGINKMKKNGKQFQGRKGAVTGRNLYGDFVEIFKNSIIQSNDNKIDITDNVSEEMGSAALRKKMRDFFTWRDAHMYSNSTSTERISSKSSPIASFMPVDPTERELDIVNNLLLNINDLDVYDKMTYDPESPDQEMISEPIVAENPFIEDEGSTSFEEESSYTGEPSPEELAPREIMREQLQNSLAKSLQDKLLKHNAQEKFSKRFFETVSLLKKRRNSMNSITNPKRIKISDNPE